MLGGHADVLYEQIGDVRSFVDSKQIQPVIVFPQKQRDLFAGVRPDRAAPPSVEQQLAG